MAGAGAKKFPAFSKLSSDDVNNYLADQVIMRFATTTARDAAFGGAGEPTLAEGMNCYIDDLNVLQTYDGSNWVTTTALQTTANVSSGLVYIASGTLSLDPTPVNVTGVFSSTYKQYRLLLNCTFRDRTNRLEMRYIVGTTPTITNYYQSGIGADFAADTTLYYQRSNNDPLFYGIASASMTALSFDIYNPNKEAFTMHTGTILNANFSFPYIVGGANRTTNQFTGFQLFTNSGAATVEYQVFGYRN
jgi:hypothetical protein